MLNWKIYSEKIKCANYDKIDQIMIINWLN